MLLTIPALKHAFPPPSQNSLVFVFVFDFDFDFVFECASVHIWFVLIYMMFF